MQPKILVSIQDNSNFGDDLLYLAGLRLLSLYFTERGACFYVQSERLAGLAYSVRQKISSIPNVEYVSTFNEKSLGNDCLLVHLGGTIISSKYTVKSRFLHFLIDLFKLNEAPTPSVFMSLGVDRQPGRRSFAIRSLSTCRSLCVRDHASFVAVTELVGRYDAFVIPDSVFSFPINKLLGDANQGQPYNIVNVIRYWPFGKIDRADTYYRVNDDNVCVGFCATDKFEGQLSEVYDGTIDGLIRIVGILSRAKCLVSERYHGVVVGLMLGVPVIGNCIDTKIRSLAVELDAVELSQNYYLFLPGRTPDTRTVQQQYVSYFELAEI